MNTFAHIDRKFKQLGENLKYHYIDDKYIENNNQNNSSSKENKKLPGKKK